MKKFVAAFILSTATLPGWAAENSTTPPQVEPVPAVKALPTAPATVVAPTPAPVDVVAPPEEKATPNLLDSEEQKRAYATGVALAHFIDDKIAGEKTLHMTMNRDILMSGINDTFSGKAKMSDKDVQDTLAAFDEQVRILTEAESTKKLAKENAWFEEFAKHSDVKKSSTGLLYQINNKGDGNAVKDSDLVEVSYKGTLIDGTVVDGTDKDATSKMFRVENMPPVLHDGVKLLRKGGQITIVIPPAQASKEDEKDEGKQANSVLIYTLSLIDVKDPQ